MKRNTEPYVKTKRKQNTKRNIFIALMLIYPLLHFVVFTVYINFDTIALCFQRFNIMAGKNEFVGLYWFKKFFSEMAQSYSLQRSFINSLLFIPVTNLILLPLSVLAAYFLYKKVPFSRMYRVTFFLPSIVSITIMTMCFSFMFDSTFGVVNDLLSRLGFINPPVWLGDPNTAMPMVFFYCVWVGIGFNVVLLGGAMGRIPDDLIEYGNLEGIGLTTELFRVVIPMVWPTIGTLLVTGTTSAFTIFMQPKLLTGGGPNFSSSTIGLYVVSATETNQYNWAATVGVIFSIVGILLVMTIKHFVDKLGNDVEY
ncbi:MAG: sugar ABC transporter permease [Clostridiales bacterium]|nr:sugar ABC transporter permease [Clostridiales bacterium]